jgi:hypothetical protein
MYIANNEPLVVGNGYAAAMTHTGTMFVAGVFNGDLDTQEPVRADIPSFWDGFVIGSYEGDFASALDVGVSAVYSIGKLGGSGSVEARRYAHRSMPHVVGVDFTFNNSAGTSTLISNISQPNSWGRAGINISTKDTKWTYSPSSAAGTTCWSGSVAQAEDPALPLTKLGLCATDLRSSPLSVSVPAGEVKTFSVLAAIYTTLDNPSPMVSAARDLHTAAALSAEARWEAHVAKVDETLESGIEITGNHDLAKLVNSSFHTLVAAMRDEPEYWYSSSPGGLATDCYHGHTFWDMETWMYPNLLFFHPDLARGTIMYRVNGLYWAKKYARDTGRAGARYPWQTASSGKVASHANAEEIHIVGDVALSMWQVLYTVHYALYTTHALSMWQVLYTVHYALYTTHTLSMWQVLYTVHYALYTVHYALYTTHALSMWQVLYTVHCTLYTIHYVLYTTHTAYTMRCQCGRYSTHYTQYYTHYCQCGSTLQPRAIPPGSRRMAFRHFRRLQHSSPPGPSPMPTGRTR